MYDIKNCLKEVIEKIESDRVKNQVGSKLIKYIKKVFSDKEKISLSRQKYKHTLRRIIELEDFSKEIYKDDLYKIYRNTFNCKIRSIENPNIKPNRLKGLYGKELIKACSNSEGKIVKYVGDILIFGFSLSGNNPTPTTNFDSVVKTPSVLSTSFI